MGLKRVVVGLVIISAWVSAFSLDPLFKIKDDQIWIKVDYNNEEPIDITGSKFGEYVAALSMSASVGSYHFTNFQIRKTKGSNEVTIQFGGGDGIIDDDDRSIHFHNVKKIDLKKSDDGVEDGVEMVITFGIKEDQTNKAQTSNTIATANCDYLVALLCKAMSSTKTWLSTSCPTDFIIDSKNQFYLVDYPNSSSSSYTDYPIFKSYLPDALPDPE